MKSNSYPSSSLKPLERSEKSVALKEEASNVSHFFVRMPNAILDSEWQLSSNQIVYMYYINIMLISYTFFEFTYCSDCSIPFQPNKQSESRFFKGYTDDRDRKA